MDGIRDKLYERIAQMVALEVPQHQMAIAVGLSPERVSQLVNEPAVREMAAQFAAAELERFRTLNDAWDTVEEQAIGHVLMALQGNPDVELAVRVAQMANKAQRRGTRHARPIEAQTGVQATLHLAANFVERLEVNQSVNMAPQQRPVTQKQEDIMNAQDVQQLLSVKPTTPVGKQTVDTDAIQTGIDALFGGPVVDGALA